MTEDTVFKANAMYLQYLLDELGAQAIEPQRLLNCKHDRLLINLSPEEKEYIAKVCIDWDWNVGSAHLLQRLQAAHILTVSEYIIAVHNKNAGEAQLILAELFESDAILLVDLVHHISSTNPISIEITDILKEAVKRLCSDLCANPEVLSKNYLAAVAPLTVDDETLETFKSMHSKLFLTEGNTCKQIDEAVAKQKQWNDEFNAESPFHSMINTIVANRLDHCKVFRDILEYSLNVDFECWRFYLLFLRCVASNASNQYFIPTDSVKSMVKQFLKDQFRAFIESHDKRIFHAMMLNARQICGANEEVIGTYANWYKNTIGEMKYLIEKDEFKFTMEILIDMVTLESDPTILKTHINTYIPAPPLCNEHVLNYVQMCKSKLFYCSNNVQGGDGHMEVVELE